MAKKNKHLKNKAEVILENNRKEFIEKHCTVFTKITETKLKQSISKHVNSKYPSGDVKLENWKVGITKHPYDRHKQALSTFKVKKLVYYKCWYAGKNKLARIIEEHYCDAGMNRCAVQQFDTKESRFVYAYIVPAKDR